MGCWELLWLLTNLRVEASRHLARVLCRYLFLLQLCVFIPHCRLLILLGGDIEVNPGPITEPITVCHWNLNGHYLKLLMPFIVLILFACPKPFWILVI